MSCKHCFVESCENEIQYICPCSSPNTYSCELHLQKHLKLRKREHKYESIFLEPSKGTIDAILDLLAKENLKKKKLKKKILASYSQNLKGDKNSFEESLGNLDSESSGICNLIEKISQARKISKLEEDPVLKLLILQPEDAVKSVKEMISENSYGSVKLWLNALKLKIKSILTSQIDDLNKKIKENPLLDPQYWETKKLSILNKVNSPEVELEFRETCSLYEKKCSDLNQPLNQDYHEYLNIYHKITSLHLTEKENNKTKLIIYDTESEKGEEKILDIPQILDPGTCITQLPNGELFCYGKNYPSSGITLKIDKNYGVKILSSGIPNSWLSGIYFNNNVYHFGGMNENILDLSSKFNLNDKRWINLATMPGVDFYCHLVIFNGNILIAGCANRNLLLYSIEIDSFSTLPYEFAKGKRKILINVEKLYLIECGDGLIYESQDEYSWKQISKSIISGVYIDQINCLYNKGGIYISTSRDPRYYKFDLSQKTMKILQ